MRITVVGVAAVLAATIVAVWILRKLQAQQLESRP